MWYETVLKLVLAVFLSGIIGFEREHKNRPAGLRTHVLVCVGAAIVQITSMEFYIQVMGDYSADPFRLGAQVISGIGFLGAGTIIKEGSSIKGLTTAASLWAVACVGLTVGAGLYKEAIFATLAVFGSLKGLRILERWQLRHRKALVLNIEVLNDSKKIVEVLEHVSKQEVDILYLNIWNRKNDTVMMELTLTYKKILNFTTLVGELACISGVRNAELERA